MTELCFLGAGTRISLSILAICCAAIQAFSLLAGHYRYGKSRLRRAENVLELAVLAQSILLALMMSWVCMAAPGDLLFPVGYITGRRAVFVLVAISASAVCVLGRSLHPLAAVPGVALTMPFVERLGGIWFPPAFALALVFWTLRGIWIRALRLRELRTSISAFSVKEAIDALHSGVLFCTRDGHIRLTNRRMQRLMAELTGGVQRNANHFRELLLPGSIPEGCDRTELDGRTVFRLPDGSAWMFKDTPIMIGNRQYSQISAADVTLQWAAAIELRKQNAALEKRAGELREAIENIKDICRKEEALRAKSRIHDVFGQRVALLVRALRERRLPDIELLDIFKNGLPDELKKPPNDDGVRRELAMLTEIFSSMGVEIRLVGELPESRSAAAVFMNVIREGVTNAVRHGFSTEITITCGGDDANWTLEIANNGLSPEDGITEGCGLGDMRRRLTQAAGFLHVQTEPRFILRGSLPRGAI